MIKVLIIEDEQRAADRLEKMILSIDDNIEVVAVLDSIDSSVEWFETNVHPDLIFLDIHLSDGLSFDIFKQVNIQSPVIFTTAYDQYALKAFETNSVDYLLKPVDRSKLKISLDKYNGLKNSFLSSGSAFDIDRIIESISQNSKSYKSRFLVNKGNSFEVVSTGDIAYFYAEEKVTFLLTKNKKRYIIEESLDNLIDKLNPKMFYRINRQVVVSINAIDKISNYFNYKLILDLCPKSENVNTVISRAKVKEFKDWIKG